MKKIYSTLILALLVCSLTACSTTNNSTSTKNSSETSSSKMTENQATIRIKPLEGKESSKKVTFTEGQTVMEVMKKNFKIEEDKGLITSIDGVSQDTNTNVYWLYKINGELASKGAAETTLSQNDEVEFYMEKY